MLFVIGLGLADANDISVKGLEIIRKCDRVYLEAYTSILTVGQKELEQFYDRSVILADRELVESGAEEILGNAEKEDVAFLVVGDPFGATTHTDLVLRAREKGINVQIVHNASILNAVGCCGLQLYSFGEVVSIPYWTDTWQPDSFYKKIEANRSRNLHTLCLLDIKVKEPTMESIMTKSIKYMPPKFMTTAEAADQLLKIIEKKSEKMVYSADSLVVGLARIGSNDQQIVASTLQEMKETNLGGPLHCLVIPARSLHPLESEYLLQYATDKERFLEIIKREETL
ncbi:diphthine methyl ester synthase [Orussus abietinus]|uniref:diphthine methyl ester synthase n=1 Tax=Orussus abietinus TaxID=222816 RepID=UPI00062517EB|nr:diphthine methyl ester synthase [Orussus abietinus]